MGQYVINNAKGIRTHPYSTSAYVHLFVSVCGFAEFYAALRTHSVTPPLRLLMRFTVRAIYFIRRS